MDTVKNIYGLSEGVFKACQFLGLKFPPTISGGEKVPSDYFGDNIELDSIRQAKLRSERKWTTKKLEDVYKTFSEKFASQKPLKQNKTDLNIYFCDHVLFDAKQNGASSSDYFDFEFYNKSFATRKEFRTQRHRNLTRIICNDPCDKNLLNNKGETNEFFAAFLHRDWLKMRSCTFDDFKLFVDKHPRFFSKPYGGSFGIGAQIISVNPNDNLQNIFNELKSKNRIIEEVVTQHESLQAFCPDTVNTIRVNSFLDVHNIVHILTTGGRFGRVGKVVDNFHGGGFSVIIDPQTGIITSDGINRVHERAQKHPDTDKIFKGFQYPFWEKLRATVTKMAKMIPHMRHIGWDIAINNAGEIVLIEANVNPDVDVQQAPHDTGILNLYTPLLDELQNYSEKQMRLIGWRVNNLRDFDSAYNTPSRRDSRLQYAMNKLIPDCTSLMDLGCRNSKFVKSICPANVKYFPVDFKKHFDDVIACDFNAGDFPNIKADTILCALTAEYVEPLPQFLANMCDAAQKQILMWCRPIDKEIYGEYRWKNPFLTDFTEDFLISTMARNNFQLNAHFSATDNRSIILYDFRKT